MSESNTHALNIFDQFRSGQFAMNFAPWDGDTITIDFHDGLNANSGRIVFDAQTTNVTLDTINPYPAHLSDPAKLTEYFLAILNNFIKSYSYGWSPEMKEVPAYDEKYHAGNTYLQGSPQEIEIKNVQAQIVRILADPTKCLVAGCSNGELVRRCKEIGIDTWGFDVIPNIEDIAFPEARGVLRHGSLTNVPYSGKDGFDTVVAVDVLEHIPERDIPKMIEEWVRLGIRKLVLLINLNQFWFPGHITLRPLSWWAEQWKKEFRHVSTVRQFPHLPAVYSNDGRYNQQWTVWERVEG